MEDTLIKTILAGIAIALISGPMGCFVMWRRMSYFGDSLAHSALLGVALGILFGFNINIGIIIVCTFFAIILVYLQQKHIFPTDTLLGILAHGALAFGMIAISFIDNPDFELHDYLFGDISAITTSQLYLIYVGGLAIISLLISNWPSLLLMTISNDLAKAEGVKTFQTQLLFMSLMTIIVAISVQIIGILLITSMIIIPAATARQLSNSPKRMAMISCAIGIFSVICGILASSFYQLPSGPSIVSASVIAFTIISIARFRNYK